MRHGLKIPDTEYGKLRPAGKDKFKARLKIFLQDEFHALLNNHPLKDHYQGYRSINVTGDLRTLYKKIAKDVATFITIDTHTNLYR